MPEAQPSLELTVLSPWTALQFDGKGRAVLLALSAGDEAMAIKDVRRIACSSYSTVPAQEVKQSTLDLVKKILTANAIPLAHDFDSWKGGKLSSRTGVRQVPHVSVLASRALEECGYVRLSEFLGQAEVPEDVRRAFNTPRPGAKVLPETDVAFSEFMALVEPYTKALLDNKNPAPWVATFAEIGKTAAQTTTDRYTVTVNPGPFQSF